MGISVDQVAAERFVYYDSLDTVRFSDPVADDERQAMDIAAMGNIMIDMLGGNVFPVLSQAQSYDNQLLLSLLSPEGSAADNDDRRAFLQLARSGLVRVGVLAPDDAGGGPSLMQIFRRSLANPWFVLSGWPELNDNLELRQEVLDCLDHVRGGQMSQAVPDAVAARVEGLRAFDRNLQQSAGGIRIVGSASYALRDRVGDMLGALAEDGDEVRQIAAEVVNAASARDVSLETRSDWYRLINDDMRVTGGSAAPVLAKLKDIVDLCYNAAASQSLGSDGMSLSARYEDVAGSAAKQYAPGQLLGGRWADLTPASGRGSWLRWSDLPGLLAELDLITDPDSPERLRELEQRRREWIVRYEMAHSWGVSVRVALPAAVGTAITSLGSAVVTGVDPRQAAGASALTGVATLVAGTPAVRAWRTRTVMREEERLGARDERNTVRSRAAAWLDAARGHR